MVCEARLELLYFVYPNFFPIVFQQFIPRKGMNKDIFYVSVLSSEGIFTP